MIEMSEESAQPDVSQSQNRITKKVFFYFPILIFSITFTIMIRFQTESKIYRFVKDTLSFTDTNPIWLSTVRNATIQNLDLMTAIRIWIWIFPEFTMNEVILIYLRAKISSQLKPGSSNSGRHLKAIVDRQKSKPIQSKNEGFCNGNNSC